MHISKNIFVIILLSSTLFHRPADSYVTIQIEPDELQRFADIILQIGGMQQHYQPIVIGPSTTTRNACILSSIKALSRGAFQMMGIMLTLVGANLLTSKLEPFVNQPQFSAMNITSSKPTEMCKFDFGCDNNLCWRTCDGANKNSLSWCYTTSKHKEPEFQTCKYSHDCSPCWDCLGNCRATENN